MKEGFDREIDSLLRRRARGTAELRSWGDGDGTPGAHLDADELGAFAEGALPSAARLAAASHLADCERCRGVVVGLARVADAGAEVKHQAVAATVPSKSARPSAWGAFVASLFAPRVMRWAMPILALSLVGVVSYVALRSDKGGALQMARENRSPAAAPMQERAAPSTATDSASNANAAGLVDQDNNASLHEAVGTSAPSAQTRGHGEAEVQPAETDTARAEAQPSTASPAPPPPPAAPAEGPAELSKAAPKTASTEEGEAAKADNKEKSENRDRDKSARASEPADDVASNDATTQRRAQQSRAANEVQMPDGSRNQKRGADNNASGGYGNVANATPSRESDRAGSRSETAGRARSPRQEEQKTEDEPSPQTRVAAGHRFRRDGNAWVDVNYKPSMPSTGVHRGTEPFRALVADVPEVGRIAAALNGEVIVVVSGRAYHIR